MGLLTSIETVLLDLDGTIYMASQAVSGALELCDWLRHHAQEVRMIEAFTGPGSQSEIALPPAV